MACFFSLCCACEVVLKFAVRYSICFSCESGDSLENHLSFQNLVQGLSLIITRNTREDLSMADGFGFDFRRRKLYRN